MTSTLSSQYQNILDFQTLQNVLEKNNNNVCMFVKKAVY